MKKTLSLACCLLASACSQNYSESPPEQALRERNMTQVTAGSSASPATPESAAPDSRHDWGGLRVAVPAAWESRQPSSSMRSAEYLLPGSEAAAAELAVFKGNMGSVDANVDRWVGQFVQPDGSETADTVRRWEFSISAGMAVTMVDVSGTFSGGMGRSAATSSEGFRMLGAIVDAGETYYYLKLVGPAATVGDWASAFEEVVRASTL